MFSSLFLFCLGNVSLCFNLEISNGVINYLIGRVLYLFVESVALELIIE